MPVSVTVGYCHHWFGLSSAPIGGDKDDVSLAEPYTWHSIFIKMSVALKERGQGCFVGKLLKIRTQCM